MKLPLPPSARRVMAIVCLGILMLIAAKFHSLWFSPLRNWVAQTVASFRPGADHEHGHDERSHDDHDDHDHGSHDEHGHGAHDDHDHGSHDDHAEVASLELSPQARHNMGLTDAMLKPIQLDTYRQSFSVPAVVVERPGRSRVQVATPMTGVVTSVHAVRGEAVEPGALLFEIRLTHEDLVKAQTEFMKTLGELDVEQREINRLKDVTRSGAVAGKVLLERQYAAEKLEAALQAQRESLRLHGLSDSQIEQISQQRRLLRELQIFVPSIPGHEQQEQELKLSQFPVQQAGYAEAAHDQASPVAADNSDTHTHTHSHADSKASTDKSSNGTLHTGKASTGDRAQHFGPLVMQEVNVHQGQSVAAGETLCVLTDYDELFIEGLAFERDVAPLRHALASNWKVVASFEQSFEQSGDHTSVIDGLEIAYLANQVDPQQRTLPFYVRLPNEITKDDRDSGNRYIQWKFCPGQRLQVQVPVRYWEQQIVVPVEAIAREGAETYVFQQNGKRFDRIPVHVKFTDQRLAVIDNDGSLFPGDVVAMCGAQRMQMAIKNKSGGPIDPHAGHTH